MAEIEVVNSNLHLDVIEGSNQGNIASDHEERLQAAPAVVSPLTAQESVVCMEIYRCRRPELPSCAFVDLNVGQLLMLLAASGHSCCFINLLSMHRNHVSCVGSW